MKVVLNADLGRLGRKGDVVEVAGGYARNYLLPRNLVLMASRGTLKQAETMQRSRVSQDRRDREAFEALAQRIASSPLKIVARAGAEGQLFGSVTTSDIAAELAGALGEEVDRRKITVPDAIKSLGSHDFSVHLHPQVTAAGTVEVVSDAPVEAPAGEPAKEPDNT